MSGYNVISAKVVYRKIANLFKITNTGWLDDSIDWTGEAMDAIGYHAGFKNTDVLCTVKNHKLKFPCDLVKLLAVEYDGYRLPLGSCKTKYGIYHNSETKSTATENEELELLKLQQHLEDKEAEYETDPSDELEDYIEQVKADINSLTERINFHSKFLISSTIPYYNIINGGIETSFKEGTVRFYYKAYPVDKEGYPEIIDSYKYREAIFWYIVYMTILQGYKYPAFDLKYAEDKWESFRFKASNEAKNTGIDAMERLKNRLHSIKRGVNGYESFFTNEEALQGIVR